MPIEFFVCTRGRSCPGRGSCAIASALRNAIARAGLSDKAVVREEGCLCLCRTGPTVVVMPGNYQYGKLSVDDCLELFQSHAVLNRPLLRLLLNGANGICARGQP